MEKNTAAASSTDCNGGTATNFDDVIDVSVGYSGDFEGVGVSLTAGSVTGNTQIIAGQEYEDLNNQVYSAKLTFSGVTAIYKLNTYGDSGQSKANNTDGDGEGNVYAFTYSMGNVTVGYVHTETEFTNGSNSSASTGEMDIFGIGYNLGGGVKFEVAHGSKEEIGGADSLKDTEADVTLAKLSFGF